jgi:hypothetical protein
VPQPGRLPFRAVTSMEVFQMHKIITRGTVALAAATLLSTLGVTGASASGVASRSPARAPAVGTSHAAAVPGTQLWVRRSRLTKSDDVANSVAVSPTGDTVFVTGHSYATSNFDYATVAYNAATGARLWVQRYNGSGNRDDYAYSVAVSPAGDAVFVTGGSWRATSGPFDYTTLAYNAATGARLWVKHYNGPANGNDYATSMAVSPTGDRVFVTGPSDGGASHMDYLTIAYSG